jgi:hypothetical protein
MRFLDLVRGSKLSGRHAVAGTVWACAAEIVAARQHGDSAGRNSLARTDDRGSAAPAFCAGSVALAGACVAAAGLAYAAHPSGWG